MRDPNTLLFEVSTDLYTAFSELKQARRESRSFGGDPNGALIALHHVVCITRDTAGVLEQLPTPETRAAAVLLADACFTLRQSSETLTAAIRAISRQSDALALDCEAAVEV